MSDRADQLHAHRDFTAAELTERRRLLIDRLGGRGTVLLPGVISTDGAFPPRQSNDFYYLVGLDPLGAYLRIDCETQRSTLYLKPRNAKREDVDGPELCDEDGAFVREVSGIDEVRPLASLPGDLTGVSLLHVPRDPAEGFRQHKDTAAAYRRNVSADPLVGDHLSLPQHLHAKLAAMLPRATLADVSHVLHDLRLTKSDAELRLLREAGRLCGVAVQEAMRATKPGVREHQLAAVADYVFRAAGALGGAHKPIIAAGYANIYAMHYWRLESPLQSGDLVLMDYASDLRYYTSDIGRMWPVDGTYAAEHRALLGLCIEYHKLLLAEIRPGRTTDDIYAATRPTLQALVDGWDFADPDAEVAARALIDSKRPLSHPVGMAIHDPGNHRTRELKVGDVFAVDPELFDKKRRRYIRCEDTVVVTETGCEVLTPCPLELDDIEAHMAGGTGGMLDAFPVERMGR